MQTKYEASYEVPLTRKTRLWTCRVHQRRHRWWQCLNFSKLRWIFSLKAISVLNWTNRISSWPASFVLWKLRLLFSLKHVLVLKVSNFAGLIWELIFRLKMHSACLGWKTRGYTPGWNVWGECLFYEVDDPLLQVCYKP